MPVYAAPVKDASFVLFGMINIEKYANLPGFADASPDLVRSVLDEAAKFVEGVLQPLNRTGDIVGCVRNADATVTTPPGFKDAYDKFCEGGWGTLSADPEYGGQGLPHMLASVFEEFAISANMSFSLYPFLTQGAVAAMMAVGSDEQKRKYIPNMVSGRWTGTMNLTEPHCGTDLGLLRTRAEPQEDGTYKITGTKIFISAGEHDLAENIIHLVLAKRTGAPDNVKGISLFIVPKFLVNEDGSLGARNAVSCGSIEHKMGLHGNATCVMNYDGATGYLIGEAEKGLNAMFIMMNAARLGVGLQGLGVSEVAYQNAVAYAKDRVQGKAIDRSTPADVRADPIIVHPDVRRMLMDMRCFNEGARALTLWGALQVDLAHRAATEEERQKADDLISLLTPVIKGVLTDKGYENATWAQQCLGGHGYVEEWGMSQFVRDARIAQIYEGTNGVQAMDLVGRKLPKDGGKLIRGYFETLQGFLAEAKADARLKDFVGPLEKGLGDLQGATMWLMQNAFANPNNAGAAAYAYMNLLGLVSLGHMWTWMAQSAYAKLDQGAEDKAFYETKLLTGRYYMNRHMPDTHGWRAKVEAGAELMMAMPADAF
ncbi:MAG: acyl-CoA dehydrogenase [Sphingomonadales bacterium]|nr:MAG: acyl-CoA dehydrogenase [Sphingomonadales bacterium]